MSDELVTVATFDDPVKAAMARNYLEAGGVRAFLLDDLTVGMTWGLSNAVGGIKLQVKASHVLRAEELLENLPGDDPDEEAADLPEGAFATRETADELREEAEEDLQEQEAENPRNQAVDRLFLCTVGGLVFIPLQFYALWMLLNLTSIEGEVSAARRWKVWVSVLLNIPLLSVIFIPLFCLAGLFHSIVSNR
jgi:hypothetical protein